MTRVTQEEKEIWELMGEEADLLSRYPIRDWQLLLLNNS
jgi:hypothetical protein